MADFDVWSTVARAKLGASVAWEWYAIEVLNSARDVLVTGGIPNAGVKGRRKWRGVTGEKVVVTQSEKDAAELEYESTTGNCRDCFGEKQTLAIFHVDGTRTYRPCHRCNATGSPLVTPL
jgi:hypothetical protein